MNRNTPWVIFRQPLRLWKRIRTPVVYNLHIWFYNVNERKHLPILCLCKHISIGHVGITSEHIIISLIFFMKDSFVASYRCVAPRFSIHSHTYLIDSALIYLRHTAIWRNVNGGLIYVLLIKHGRQRSPRPCKLPDRLFDFRSHETIEYIVAHWSLATSYGVNWLGQYWFKQWLLAYSVPSTYQKQSWFVSK